MTARPHVTFQNPLSTSTSPEADAGAARWLGPAAAFALGFLSFLPYPAISVGGSSAIQLGNLLTLLLLIPCLMLPWRHRPVFLYAVLMVPLLLSAIWVNVSNVAVLDLSFKGTISWALAALVMVVVQCWAPRYSLTLLTGIAVATIVHVLVGAVQFVMFAGREFPLLDLYVNQSFASVQDNAFVISHYIQRPFGIFPEPSAMSSSLAPWILLWLAEIFGLVRLRQSPARWQRILFGIAAVGGLALIIASRSGHAMITMAAVVLFGVIWLQRARITAKTLGVILVTFGLVLPVSIWLTTLAMGDRLSASSKNGSDSWEDRSNSLRIGFSLWAHGDLPTITFGLGVGQTSAMVDDAAGLIAVWSVSLTYIYETGLIGLLACVIVGGYLFRVWKSIHYGLVYATILLVWLVGITLTTSYSQLLPIWVALGWLTVWPSMFEPVTSEVHRTRTFDAARRAQLADPLARVA